MSELHDQIHPGFKALLAIFSAVTAMTSGLLTGLCARDHRFPIIDAAAASFAFTLSVCSITLPLVFAIFPWQPGGLYFDIATMFIVGVLFSEKKTA